MAILIVNSSANDGPGSLRQALADASNGDVARFDPNVFPPATPTSIRLESALTIEKSVEIDGSGANVVLSPATGAARRAIVASTDFVVKKLTLERFGDSNEGADVSLSGRADVSDCAFGGGLYCGGASATFRGVVVAEELAFACPLIRLDSAYLGAAKATFVAAPDVVGTGRVAFGTTSGGANATFSTSTTLCGYGAGVSALSVERGGTSDFLTPSAADATKRVLLERRDQSAETWTIVSATARGSSVYEAFRSDEERRTYRVWDGSTFVEASAQASPPATIVRVGAFDSTEKTFETTLIFPTLEATGYDLCQAFARDEPSGRFAEIAWRGETACLTTTINDCGGDVSPASNWPCRRIDLDVSERVSLWKARTRVNRVVSQWTYFKLFDPDFQNVFYRAERADVARSNSTIRPGDALELRANVVPDDGTTTLRRRDVRGCRRATYRVADNFAGAKTRTIAPDGLNGATSESPILDSPRTVATGDGDRDYNFFMNAVAPNESGVYETQVLLLIVGKIATSLVFEFVVE